MSEELEYIAEIDTALGPEHVHVIERGTGAHASLVWHGFDSVNRFFHWDYLLQYGRLIRLGLPGHGPVPAKNWSQCRNWTSEHFAEVAVGSCRRFSQESPLTLVGHSTGAFLALCAATRRPAAVSRLLLINPLVWSPVGSHVKQIARTWLWRCLATLALSPAIWRKRRSVPAFLDGLRSIVRDTKAFYENPNTRSYTEIGHADYRRSSLSALIGTARVCATCDLREALTRAKLDMPALIIHGEEDPISPVYQSEWLAKQLGRATLITLPGVGHLSYGEREHECAEIITEWMNAQIDG